MSRSYSVFEKCTSVCVFSIYRYAVFLCCSEHEKQEIAVYLWKNNNETKILWIKKLLVQ